MILVAAAIVSAWQAGAARRAEWRANVAAARAIDAERQTRQERDEAEAARQSLRQALYASDMQLAQSAWGSGNVVRMLDLLDGQRPAAGQADLRGFEWHYLRRLGSTSRTVEVASPFHIGTISPDGTRFVGRFVPADAGVAHSEETVELKLIDVDTRRTLRTIATPFGDQYRWPFFFSPDGNGFGFQTGIRDRSAKIDWRVKVWDWKTGREIGALSGLPVVPTAKALDRSGDRLALGFNRRGGGCDLKVWQIEDGKELYTVSIPERSISGTQALTFSPDRIHLAGITGPSGRREGLTAGEVRIWEASTGKEVLKFATGPGSAGLAYRPDGQFLAVAGTGGAPHRLQDAPFRTGGSRAHGDIGPRDLADGRLQSGRFPPGRGELVRRIEDLGPHQSPCAGRRPPEFSSGGNNLGLEQPAWSADGRLVKAYVLGGSVVEWRLPPRAARAVVRGPERGTFVTAAADAAASRFAAAFEVPNDRLEVKVWDEAGDFHFGATEDISAISLQFAKLRLSRDGKCLALLAWTWDRKSRVDPGRHRLRVWDLATGRELFRRDRSEFEMSSVAALSPVGRLLAVSTLVGGGEGPERKVRTIDFSLRDLAAGRERLQFELPGVGEGDRIVGLTFSPDGRRLAGALGGAKGSLRAWDTTTGKAIMARAYTRGLSRRSGLQCRWPMARRGHRREEGTRKDRGRRCVQRRGAEVALRSSVRSPEADLQPRRPTPRLVHRRGGPGRRDQNVGPRRGRGTIDTRGQEPR